MQTILQSGFLHSLAYALLNSFWQMGLLWLVVIFIIKFLKLTSAQKFNLAFYAQFAGFIFFIFSLINSFSGEEPADYFVSNHSTYINIFSGYLQTIMPLAGVVYLLILIPKVTILFSGFQSIQQMRNQSLKKAPAVNRIFIQEMSSLFSIKKKVGLYISENIKCPLTFGFLKPVILLPVAIINNLTREQMEAVILHELAHIKRADYILNLIQCFIARIFFFNVFSDMLSDIIERERENACDDWVIQFKYNTYHYAEALLKLGRLQTSASLAMAISGKTENILLLRIKRLLHDEENNLNYKTSFIVFNALTLFFAFTLMFITSINYKKAEIISSVVSKNIMPAEIMNKPLVAFQYLNNLQTSKPVDKHIEIAEAKSSIKESKKTVAKSESLKPKPIKTIQSSSQTSPYIVSVNNMEDSRINIAPEYSAAINSKIILDSSAIRQAISYQNFKRLETMLALTGDSIKISEDPSSKNNYKRLITIETTDKNGNRHIYKVQVELYQ